MSHRFKRQLSLRELQMKKFAKLIPDQPSLVLALQGLEPQQKRAAYNGLKPFLQFESEVPDIYSEEFVEEELEAVESR